MTGPQKRLSQFEFVALMAMMIATIAFSIDAMLPSLPLIGAELTPDALNRAQLVITSFVLGMGIGTLFTGPLSDAFGRKPIMLWGAAVYCVGAAVAWAAPTLEILLAARVLQGAGAAGPRVVSMAMTRDLYAGRGMARIMSFIMLIFALGPALAPTFGYYVAELFGWRSIFLMFVFISFISTFWMMLRQPETLAPEHKRPLQGKALWAAFKEVFSHPTTRLSILIQTLTLGMLFTILSSIQQSFHVTFGQGDVFHLWFGGIAIVAASASILNARLVVTLGMRAIVRGMLIAQIAVSFMMVVLTLMGGPYWLLFGAFLVWTTANFFQSGLTIGNLNALGMEPMGHIAGMAASVIAALATIGGVLIAVPVGLAFNGTPLPAAVAVLICACVALYLTIQIKRPGELETEN